MKAKIEAVGVVIKVGGKVYCVRVNKEEGMEVVEVLRILHGGQLSVIDKPLESLELYYPDEEQA